MKTTGYFENQVLPKRSYLKRDWCERVRKNPETRAVQENGRISFWGWVPEFAEAGPQFKGRGRYLRVITEPDGETIHNAYPDRDYAKERGNE
ncbi:MAG: hypothetical protein CYG60_08505 [Actinobacteria bacterium]|nr:MAG: hypothetical protein CYG60_08505 [Actinomycetota bacterium]